jgi:hypothetical protein
MRILKEIPHPEFKITLYAWNNRYLIKVEQGLLEQTFKVNQFDVSREDDIERLLDEEFLARVADGFHAMANSLQAALQRL